MALTKPGSEREPLLTAHNTNAASDEQQDVSSQLSTKHEGIYPDGGWPSWAVVLGSFCSFFSGLGMVNSLGAYQSYIATHQLQHESNTRLGFIFSLHTMLIFSAGLFFGPLFDRDGPRPLAATGAALSLVSYISLGFCTSYWHFLVSIGVIGGLSGALLFTCALSTIPHWFLRRRSVAMSLAISGGSVGGIVFPTILGGFLPKLGLAWTTRVIALTMLPFHVIAILLLKSRFSSPNHETCWPDLSILFIPRTSGFAVALLLVELSLYIPVGSVTSFATAQGHSPEVAYRLLTYLSLGLTGWSMAAGLFRRPARPYEHAATNPVHLHYCLARFLAAGRSIDVHDRYFRFVVRPWEVAAISASLQCALGSSARLNNTGDILRRFTCSPA
ncbi:hypothetical protein LTS07_007321 [Exophiala sideris]|uniref:Major facilitator superfamily (MFS) profile domain-containing protein n=1 Tax=Exophiala sideris TaxID=1016849 RepID=A0ABR0J3N2_9EURO|nr:hypothetical protein LTS07_007321 [Exophiala sideris]KAK5034026.1 hypothetical protein LTR13_006626 [Exophiala sideris]KAK5055699.1 hypothetical protein LTR69_008074 [Exophiala sideris]KAK5180968.1 hypothetical protein LTR44_006788 [Eurotiomycetes sp. CCFEE 6388]